MAGYIRQDVSNNIANGNVIDADDFDNEFDAIASAFNTSTGHSHDGSSAEGAPITVVGPAQDVIVSATAVAPKTDDAYDLGSASNEWKDLYVDGTAYIDTLTVDAGTVDGSAITTAANTQTLTNKTVNLSSNTLTATSAQLAAALTDETGTGSVVFSGSPALTGVPTAPTAAVGTNTTQLATTAHVFAERTSTATLTNKTLTSPTVNSGSFNTPTINSGSPLTATSTELNTASTHFVPSGGIIMWSGSVVSIPTGWLLCDGTNGTPNLQNRFIVGAGDTHAPGATGGADSITLAETNLPSHTHSFSATTGAAGSHSHSTTSGGEHTHRFTYGVRNIGGSTAGGFGPSFFGSPITAVDDGSITEVRVRDNMVQNVNSGHAHSISTAADHTHTVSGTTGATGSGTAFDNRPAFYALAYIMKA